MWRKAITHVELKYKNTVVSNHCQLKSHASACEFWRCITHFWMAKNIYLQNVIMSLCLSIYNTKLINNGNIAVLMHLFRLQVILVCKIWYSYHLLIISGNLGRLRVAIGRCRSQAGICFVSIPQDTLRPTPRFP